MAYFFSPIERPSAFFRGSILVSTSTNEGANDDLSYFICLAVQQVPLLICPFWPRAAGVEQEVGASPQGHHGLFRKARGTVQAVRERRFVQHRGDDRQHVVYGLHLSQHAPFDGLASLEKDMDWEGKHREAGESTGAFPAEATVYRMKPGSEDAKSHELREELVDHLTYSKKRGGGGVLGFGGRLNNKLKFTDAQKLCCPAVSFYFILDSLVLGVACAPIHLDTVLRTSSVCT